MPIVVRCPSCSTSFSVKDEYAGKRTKCPKCGGPMTIPTMDIADTVRMPYPPAAPRPKQPVASRPADDDEDNRPRSKKRLRDEDDDRPERRGGGGKAKKSALPLVLGILAGALVLCGGGCAGLYFFLIQPAVEKANEIVKNSGKTSPPEEPTPKPTEAAATKLLVGMSPAEVSAVVGPGSGYKPTAAKPVAINVSPDRQRDTLDRWVAKIEAGCVEERLDGQTQLLVAYSHPPQAGGTVLGVVFSTGYLTSPASRELIALPPLPLPAENRTPQMLTIPDTLLRTGAIVLGQYVQVTGRVEQVSGPAGENPPSIRLVGSTGAVLCQFPAGRWVADKYRPDDEVQVVGKVARAEPKQVTLELCEVLVHTPPAGSELGAAVTATALIGEYLKDSTAAGARRKGKLVKVSGTVQSASGDTLVLTAGQDGNFTCQLSCTVDADHPADQKKVGAEVTLIGRVQDYSIHPPTRTKALQLTGCKPAK